MNVLDVALEEQVISLSLTPQSPLEEVMVKPPAVCIVRV